MLQTRPCSSSSAAAAARCFPLDSRARCVLSPACAAAWPRRPPQARWQRARRIPLRSSMVVASASSSEEGRSSPSSSSSSLPAEISRGVPWPRRLLGGRIDDSEGSVKDRPFTVYTVRLRTSSSRDAEPDDPEAGVLLCLIAESGDAVVRRVARVADPQADADDAAEACAAAGAACDAGGFEAVAALEKAAMRSSDAEGGSESDSSSSSSPAASPPRTRFQRGCVDEISFAAPDLLSPIAAAVVSPQGGFGGTSTWRVDEVSVATTSQRPGEPAARFVFKGEAAGGSRGALAAAAVPADAVVVGAGDRAAVLTKRQAEALRAAGLERYAWLKGRALATAAALVAAGGALLLAAAWRSIGGGGGEMEHPESVAALPFLAGGGAGLLYGWLLQAGVDAVGVGGGGNAANSAATFAEASAEEVVVDESGSDESESEQEEDEDGDGAESDTSSVPVPQPQPSFLSRAMASAPLRAVLVVGAGAALFSAASHTTAAGGGVGIEDATTSAAAAASAAKGGAERLLLVRQLLAAAAGFSMYKIGLVATVAAADYSDAAAAERERREREREEGGKNSKGGKSGSAKDGGGGGRQRRVTSISSDDEN